MYKKGYKPNRVITPAELKKNFVVTVIKIFQKDAVMNNAEIESIVKSYGLTKEDLKFNSKFSLLEIFGKAEGFNPITLPVPEKLNTMDVEVHDDVSDYEPTGRLIIDESAVVDSEDEEPSNVMQKEAAVKNNNYGIESLLQPGTSTAPNRRMNKKATKSESEDQTDESMTNKTRPFTQGRMSVLETSSDEEEPHTKRARSMFDFGKKPSLEKKSPTRGRRRSIQTQRKSTIQPLRGVIMPKIVRPSQKHKEKNIKKKMARKSKTKQEETDHEEEADVEDKCSNNPCKVEELKGKHIYWVQCDACDSWFHTYCKLSMKAPYPEDEEFRCECEN
uniref:Zinc finger PHD-type domain-containing protein n=1 Tax=Acrobeloides nanus TaxID=290746 RepID=A0A914C9E7_9BILA